MGGGVLLGLVLAMPWYVDGDAETCPGDGSDEAPFCTVQEAFDLAELEPGDEILIRDAATPYAGGDINNVSGDAENPIVLRPDDGHAPIFASRIELIECSHWTVRGLVFDGTGSEQDTISAISIYTDEVVVGIVIEDNTIVEWGPLPDPDVSTSSGSISLNASDSVSQTPIVGPVIRRNRIAGTRGRGIRARRTDGAVIEDNEISDVQCLMDFSGPRIYGIHAHISESPRIRRNYIHDIYDSDCEIEGLPKLTDLRTAAILVQGSDDTEVHHNYVARIGNFERPDDDGAGITVINTARDVLMHHNIVVDCAQAGIGDGVFGSGGGVRTRLVHNTVVGGPRNGIELRAGSDAVVRGNVVAGAGTPIRLFTDNSSAWTIEDNLYFSSGKELVAGAIQFAAAEPLEDWRSACGCDADSAVGDPLIPRDGAERFTPSSDSPAIDAGNPIDEIEGHHGAGPDLGALEAPLPLSAMVEAAAPSTVRLELEFEGPAPLQAEGGCEGLVVLSGRRPRATAGCEVLADTLVEVQLVDPAYEGEALTLAYGGSGLSDAARIGGFINAEVQPFSLEVDNQSTEPEPAGDDDDDDDASTGGGDDDDDDDDATGGDDDDDDDMSGDDDDDDDDDDDGGGSGPGLDGTASGSGETDAGEGGASDDSGGCACAAGSGQGRSAVPGGLMVLAWARRRSGRRR